MKPKKPNLGESLAASSPDLAREWHPTKNGELKPEDVSTFSHKKVWWKCPKGDDHEWKTSIATRSGGSGCTICSGRKIVNSNCLATIKPDLANEWHPAKNGNLTPYYVSAYSNKKVWWKCPKGADHEWETAIYNRSFDRGCPVCSNKKVVLSNCLATLNSELAKEWHLTKNDNLTPFNVTPGSNKSVWWKCPKGADHEWRATVVSRNEGRGCAICANKIIVLSNCLATLNSELVKEWHPTKNGDLTPYDVSPGSHKRVWWKCPKGDDHVWRAIVKERNKGTGCPICRNQKVVLSNCLATLDPELSKEWHPTKNGDLTPYDLTPQSEKKVWWKCPKGEDHEWKTTIATRSGGSGCLVCCNQKVVESNSLAALIPKLAKEWHPTKNGDLTPYDVAPGSNKKVWWKCPRSEDHEWQAPVVIRTKGHGCGVCSNRIVVLSNCLATLDPGLSKEWHPTKNGDLTSYDVVPYSHKKVWWNCPKGDDHAWKTSVKARTYGSGCPLCRSASSTPELRIFCELKTIFPSIQHRAIIDGYEVDIYVPSLNLGIEYDGEYWHRDKVQKDQEKNLALQDTILLLRVREIGLPVLSETDIQIKIGKISVETIKIILRFIMKYRKPESSNFLESINNYFKHEDWSASDHFHKLHTERNNVVFENSISFLFPDLVKIWHPTRNDPLLPEHFTPGSEKIVWWQNHLGYEWQERINYRVSKERRRHKRNQLYLFKDQE